MKPILNRASVMNQGEVRNYFQSLLSPNTKVYPEATSYSHIYEKSGDTSNVDDPSTLRLNKDSSLSPNTNEKFTIFQTSTEIAHKPKTSIIVHKSKSDSIAIPMNRASRLSRSIGSLSKMIGQITKNAMTDMNNSVKGKEYNDEYLKSLDAAFRLLDMSNSQSPFLKAVKQFIFFNIQIFIFFMNLLSVINLVLVTDYRLKELDESYEWSLKVTELGVAIFFSIEVLISIKTSNKKLRQMFCFNVISNILLIIEIITTTLFSSNFQRINKIFIFIYIMRSFKLIKLRMIIEFTLKEFKKLVRNEKILQNEVKNEQAELKYFVYSSALDIGIGIFIEATAFMAFNEALDYDGYHTSITYSDGTPIPVNFNYIGAAYYSIVTLTTIGYGDVFPNYPASRLYNIAVMFFNLSVLSSFLGKMTEKMYELSPYIRNFYFKNHIVIIGEIPMSFLKFFIKELYQCDILTSTVYNQDNSNTVRVSKIILVGKENPSRDMETWLEDFSNDFTEIKYLKSNFLENLWQKQTNVQYARHVFAFSMNSNENQAQGFESDKQMSYNIQRVVNNFPKLEITLVLSTEYTNQIKNDSLWSKVTVISAQILNEYIMANSLENQGLNIWLTHLATLREKSAPMYGSDLNHLEEYAQNMSQEIYPIKLPSFFIGKSFQEVMKLCYFSTIDLSDSFSVDYSEIEANKKNMPNKAGILLIGIEYKDEMGSTISKFLINPLNYVIRKDDIGYVVAYDLINAKTISNFNEKSPLFSTYLKNMNLFKKLKVAEGTSKYIEKLRVQLNERFNDWKINKQKFVEKSSGVKQTTEFDSKLLEIPDIFNLYNNVTPKGVFKNHIIIKGDLFRLRRIASVLRSYSERPIILLSDVQPNPSEWHKIRDSFRNVYYVYGCTTNINHLMQIDPKKAFKILILSSNFNNFVLDSESIIFTRIISDFFEVKNFLTELMDENNMKYISINPKYDKLDYFFWPFFVRGSVHFSSLAMSIIAKSINNKNWLSFIRNLTRPNNSIEKDMENFEQNSRINSLEITEEIKKEFQFFGQLQYVLMSHEPHVIGIAVLKSQFTSNEPKKKTFLKQMTCKEGNDNKGISDKKKRGVQKVFSHHILKIMDNFYGSEFLMTNPSFLMPLDVGDKVLVIGNTKMEDTTEYFGKMINSSFKLATPRDFKDSKEKNKTQEDFLKKNKTLDDCLKFSFKLDDINNQRTKKMSIFKEKLENNLSNFNDFMKYVLNNWEDLNEEKMKISHF